MTAISAASATESDSHETANPFPDLSTIRGPTAGPRAAPPARTFPTPRFGDYSRTRFESRVAFGGPDEEPNKPATQTRRFTVFDVTSGLPDDSREEDQRSSERRVREARARVKAARAMAANTPELGETLQRDWRKAALFYARYGITEAQFRYGVPVGSIDAGVESTYPGGTTAYDLTEKAARESAALPDSGPSVYGLAP